jgi:hypothetical protein
MLELGETFPAEWSGQCECGAPFDSGALVAYDYSVKPRRLILQPGDHDCETFAAPMDEIGVKPSNVCPKCFLVHAGECY